MVVYRKIAVVFVTVVLLFFILQSCSKGPAEETLATTLETEIPRLMEAADIPGLSMAVVQDSQIIWRKAFGVKSRDTMESVDRNTMFEAASLTKTVTAYAAMRLVERGELDLDKPLYEYFPNREYPRLAKDERYKKITARLVLTHTTGLPNWGNRLMRDPGIQYAYSGEGFLYLGRTIEQISGLSLQEFAQKEIFDPLGMAHTSYIWNETYAANGACGHDRHGKASALRKNSDPNGGASLLTTANDYATFICALLNGQGLSGETIERMTSSQVQVTVSRESAELFPNVFWGWGWGVQPGNTGFGFWHWGDNGDLRAYTVTYKDRGKGFVYFANSNNGLAVAGAVSSLVFDDHQYALDWLDYEEYDDPERLVRLTIEKAFMDESAQAGMQKIQEAKETFPELVEENSLTEIAQYIGESGKKEEAIALLKFCLESYPQSSDAYMVLGVTYLDMGRNQDAIDSFEGSLRIRKGNRLATRGLQWARDALNVEKKPVDLSAEEMQKFLGDYGPRRITLRGGRLYYQRDGRPEYGLIPIGKNTFALEGYGPFRMEFVEDESGKVIKIVGHYIYGNTDQSLRTR